MWNLLLIVATAGGIGGCVNALLSDNGFVMPRAETTGVGSIVRPGFLGNILIGAVAAAISWGLYGPFASAVVFGAPMEANPVKPSLSLSALVGAVLIGIGGARWLTNEVDKKLLKAAAARAARSKSDSSSAEEIAQASPAEALKIAKRMPQQ